MRGSLPWQGLKAATNKQKYEKIGEKKQQTNIKELCDGFPEEFANYLTYARKLGFEETPDYDYLRGLMNKVLQKINETDDGVYDWMLVDKSSKKDGSSTLNATNDASRQRPTGTAAHTSNMQLVGSQNDLPKRSGGEDKSQNLTAIAMRNSNASGSRLANNNTTGLSSPNALSAGVGASSGMDNTRQGRPSNADRQEGGFKRWFLTTFCCRS